MLCTAAHSEGGIICTSSLILAQFKASFEAHAIFISCGGQNIDQHSMRMRVSP